MGTHPIFESDFDCLTGIVMSSWTGVNCNKAGMGKAPREEVDKIVNELSRDSEFTKKQKEKDEIYREKGQKIRELISQASSAMFSENEKIMEEMVRAVEFQLTFDRLIVHVDMDMFFAACEERENPELEGKLFDVGDNSMLSTSNYEARKYGIRAAMPGYIGKVLARRLAKKELIIVPSNYRLYSEISKEDQTVLDDQYVTSISDQKENLDSNIENEEHENIKNEILKLEEDFRTRSCPYCWRKYFKDDINGAVEEMRYKVFKLTRLTCSAGIGCNGLVAKVASDMNK